MCLSQTHSIPIGALQAFEHPNDHSIGLYQKRMEMSDIVQELGTDFGIFLVDVHALKQVILSLPQHDSENGEKKRGRPCGAISTVPLLSRLPV